MLHMRQPFFSIVSAIIYLFTALIVGGFAGSHVTLAFGDMPVSSSIAWLVAGLFFIMAYFSLVHLSYDKKRK